MEIGASSSVLNGTYPGNAANMAAVSQEQAAQITQLLLTMYALKTSVDLQQAAALAIIQSAEGIGQHIDRLA